MASNTTNSYQYWDNLDGDAMVCSPNGPVKYRPMCTFNQYVLGAIFIMNGLSLLHNARRLDRLLVSIVPEEKEPVKNRTNQHARTRAQASYFKRLIYVLGVEFLGFGFVHLVGGNGTVYSASTLPGLFSDITFSVVLACSVYVSLLQLRGAEAFRNLVELPNFGRQQQTKPTKVLDMAQSIGVFPITLGFWVLLASKVLSRPGFYTALYALMACAGVRSMLENILWRARTLAHVDTLQQNAGGNLEAKRRRRNIVKKKARALIFHMLIVLIINVFLPLSALIFGSVYSSTQVLIHNSACYPILAAVISVMCVTTHKHVTKSCEKETNRMHAETKIIMTSSALNGMRSAYTVANESGLSVVGISEVARVQQNKEPNSREKLFSISNYD